VVLDHWTIISILHIYLENPHLSLSYPREVMKETDYQVKHLQENLVVSKMTVATLVTAWEQILKNQVIIYCPFLHKSKILSCLTLIKLFLYWYSKKKPITTLCQIYTVFLLDNFGLGLWCLKPLLTIFQLYRGGQFYWWRKP
jgi:uncharacterized membrane protein YozB (DUF420 family)